MFRRVKAVRAILAKDDLAVEKATEEVRSKTGEEVDRETANTWAARAVASYRLSVNATSIREKVTRFSEGDDYRHEALEHAGTSGDSETLRRVESDTAKERTKALDSFGD